MTAYQLAAKCVLAGEFLCILTKEFVLLAFEDVWWTDIAMSGPGYEMLESPFTYMCRFNW